MATFKYVALTREGRKVRDKIEAETEGEAIRLLEKQGVFPTSIEPVAVSSLPVSRTALSKPSVQDENDLQKDGQRNVIPTSIEQPAIASKNGTSDSPISQPSSGNSLDRIVEYITHHPQHGSSNSIDGLLEHIRAGSATSRRQ
jgi:hypothetical protein